MKELERLEEMGDRVTDFQVNYNKKSKNVAYIIGKNLTLIVCMLVPLLLVSFVWTEFGGIIFHYKMITDGIVTVVLFAVGQIMMERLGCDGGRMDTEFLEQKAEFDSLVAQVGKIGTRLMGVFCDWQIDCELEKATRFAARQLKITPKMWQSIEKMSYADMVKEFGENKAKKIQAIKDLPPIELNEAILLYDGDVLKRGSLPESAEEHLHKRSKMITQAIGLIFTGLLTVVLVITLTSDITLARVIYTAYKLILLFFRMAMGYSDGAKAYNTIEVKRLKAKSTYLREYIRFIEEKTYMELIDQYEELQMMFPKEEKSEA